MLTGTLYPLKRLEVTPLIGTTSNRAGLQTLSGLVLRKFSLYFYNEVDVTQVQRWRWLLLTVLAVNR
ncbi:MAG: hypothetical protein KF832_00445 [Caldilineaceae bacterium]|nr:hypothetical protein [Caldilineaceae bacterium]